MRFFQRFILFGLIGLGVVACGVQATSTAAEQVVSTPAALPTGNDIRKVRLGVGYIPDVQFVPFYVAQQKGYYADEGLEVEIEYGFENDFVSLAAQGQREFAIASGDQVILARAQGLPIAYVMKWYQRYPVALMALANKGIAQPQDLTGKKVGLPGLFGASFIGWKALVHAASLNESAINIEEIGFTQAAAVQQGLVDAAMIYIANEPNQLRSQGFEVTVIEISDYINLVSNGLVVGEKLLADNPDLVQRMVRATLRGLKDTLENPDEAFIIVRQVIPEMTDDKATIQRKVLEDSIKLWQTEQLGVSDVQAWQDSIDFMHQTGLLNQPLEPEGLFTNKFVETQ
jgi:NitT/TauT family transport system substrate-binding protein